MGKQRRLRMLLACAIAVVFLFACGDYFYAAFPVREPAIVYPPAFQWHHDASATPAQMSIPTTASNPGPAIALHVAHERGFGPLIHGSGVMDAATRTGQQVIAVETDRLKAQGWQILFTPTETGSYPQYVLYVTLRAGSHYCFVEYSATALSADQASQQLDIYHA
jgi:hypothetical protein